MEVSVAPVHGRSWFSLTGRHRWLLALVLGLTFAVYSGTLAYQFVHDDRGQIVENPVIHSWHYVPRYFTEHVWAAIYPEELGNYYRPVFLLWLRINDAIFGGHAWGWHLTTVLLHLLATFFVYRLGVRIMRDPLAGVVAAMVFGLHPVHIEGVAWVSGVTEPLLAVVLIPSFLLYLKKKEQPKKANLWMAFSVTLFAVALLAKETALILPAIIMAYEWILGNGKEESFSWTSACNRMARALAAAAPYLALIPVYSVARIHALKGFSHIVTPLPFSTMLFTWPGLAWFWVKHLIWPAGLSTFYDFPSVTHPGLLNFALPVAGLLVIALLVYGGIRRSPEAAFASVWLVLPLIPLLDIRVFVQDDFAHDRYLYLPSIGLAILFAIGLRNLQTDSTGADWQSPIKGLVSLGLATILGVATVSQGGYFANNLVFYLHNLKHAPNNKYAMSNLATVMGEQGMYAGAVKLFERALEKDPNFWPAAYNLGYTYYRIGNLEAANQFFRRAIQINPHKADEYLYLGMTLFKMGRLDDAETNLRRAIMIRPTGYGYHFALGVVLKTRGNLEAALDQFKAELAVSPGQAAAREQIAATQGLLRAK